MSSRRLISCALCAIALTSLPGTALADPTRQEWADWKQLVESAKKAMREGRPADAVTALQRADGIHKSPTVAMDLATALTAAGKLVEARKVLTRITESTDQSVLWKRARDTAKKALADLGPRVPSLRIAVSGAPGAAVTVDGEKVATDADVALDPGNHDVRATADGFRDVERTVSLAAGKRESITLEMMAAPPSGAAAAPSDQRGSRVPGIVILSIGGAALAVGGVLGGLAFSAASSAKAVCAGTDCPPSAAADIDRSKLFGNASTGLFVGGGVFAMVGIILTIVAPGGKKAEPAKDSASVAPFFGPGMVGVTGRF